VIFNDAIMHLTEMAGGSHLLYIFIRESSRWKTMDNGQ